MAFDSDIGAVLRQFAAAIQNEALRPAAAAAAEVFYGEMKLRTASFAHTGTLNASIYQWHDTKLSGQNKQVYAIGPNKIKAPHWHLVEFGTIRSAAHPYIRPTWDSKLAAAMEAGNKRLSEKISEIAGKM